MARPTSRRTLRFENLEDRQLLSSAAPNNDQQLALQLINMARTTPQAAAQWLTQNVSSEVKNTLKHYNVDVDAVKSTIASSRPLPPVAWNGDLAEAAQQHSQDMADNQYQSHTGSDGSSSDDRIKAAGYKADSTGENAFAYANSVDNAMQAFLYDWGVADAGHRRNLIQPGVAPSDAFTDVGVGVVKTSARPGGGKLGPVVVTQNFGSRSDAPTQLVGVVYDDKNGDDFYTPGEGKGGVSIDATNLDTGKTQSAKSWDSGGYQIPLAKGRYQVTASENSVVIKQVDVSVTGQNVAQDFRTSEKWDGRSLRSATPVVSTTSATKAEPVRAASAPVVNVSAPTPAAAPKPVSVTVTPSTSTNDKVAFFAPADWKGPKIDPTSKNPLADWTTWKAKAD
ncbi:CAP domain-containing protein [Planctomyces sp. SH-PL62]|uniref:CAP domain-containing protein n=1 Tax=Planctomyces sp. SH-PL62 TaxID=1636152 RepID=UPI00078B52A6|nr:CAP domain-containing protein [Planctomyces sp. SH-PL62]AMV38952.1 Cysteine-rich secretory protein family protein [Planctomyces sp. SH-PL62]